MFDRFTENAKNAMNIAADISRRTRNSVVGSEHILLALTYVDGKAKELLAQAGVTSENYRIGSDKNGGFQVQFSTRVRRIEEVANSFAQQTNSYYADTQHLLLAILADNTTESGVASTTKQARIQFSRNMATEIMTTWKMPLTITSKT